MKKYIQNTLLIIGLLYLSLLGFLFLMQDYLVYQYWTPIQYIEDNFEGFQSPAERDMLFKNVHVRTSDGLSLKGWLIHQQVPKDHPTIVFFSDNPGNIGLRMPYFQLVYFGLRVNILAVHWRGYSGNEGKPSEEGLQRDADAILDYAFNQEKDIDREKVFVQGRSMGGAVAIYAVSTHQHRYPIRGASFESTITSVEEMFEERYSLFAPFKALVLRNYWPSIDRIKKIKDIPLQFAAGKIDPDVPYEMTVELYKAAGSKDKQILLVEDGEHDNAWYRGGHEYLQTMRDFLDRTLGLPQRDYREVAIQREDAIQRKVTDQREL